MAPLTMILSSIDGRLQSSDRPAALSRGQRLAVLACALGFTFDLSEISFGATLSGVFSAPPHAVPPAQLSWLLASTYIGAILGPPFTGAVSDRKGPRRALLATLLFLAATSVASAASPDIVVLTILRGLAGIALGAYPPLMITYLTGILPERARGRWIMATVAIAYLGPPTTVFLMRWLTPLQPLGLEGWRWLMAVDGIGALLSCTLFLYVPDAVATPEKASRRESTLSRSVALALVISFLAPWATVTFPLLSAAYLVIKGFSLSDTLLFIGVSTFGPFVASVLVAPFADRIARRTSIVTCATGMVAAAIGFYVSEDAFWLTLTSFAFNLFIALYMPALNTFIAERFPARVRGRGTSWAWSANRVAAAAVPLAMLPWLHSHQEARVFSVIVASLLMTIFLVVGVRSYDA